MQQRDNKVPGKPVILQAARLLHQSMIAVAISSTPKQKESQEPSSAVYLKDNEVIRESRSEEGPKSANPLDVSQVKKDHLLRPSIAGLQNEIAKWESGTKREPGTETKWTPDEALALISKIREAYTDWEKISPATFDPPQKVKDFIKNVGGENKPTQQSTAPKRPQF